MKFVFASDAFKGTLSSAHIEELLTRAAREYFPDCETVSIPISAGGEGTIAAIIGALKGELRTVTVHNPLMEEISASYGIFRMPDGKEGAGEKSAIIEMSSASGISLIPGDMLNPLYTTTYGTGELIRDALEQGCRRITIAIGGSATNDGGIGAMRALGVRFLDAEGKELGTASEDNPHAGGTGSDLASIASIDTEGLCPEVREAVISVLCNVDILLTGPDGATFSFGKQKCSPELDPDDVNDILSSLEAGMVNYASVLEKTYGADPNSLPGTGAAGGLGAALHFILGGTIGSGVDAILNLINFDACLQGADLCITGEGRLDWQSTRGKSIAGIARHCKKMNLPLDAIVGCLGEGYESALEMGLRNIITTCGDAPLEKAMINAEEYYLRTARDYFRRLKG